MHMRPHALAGLAGAVIAWGFLPGCSMQSEQAFQTPAGRQVTPEAFVGTSNAKPVPTQRRTVRVVSAAEASEREVVGIEQAASATPGDADQAMDDPANTLPMVTASGAPLIDAKVGDLNGAPIFAKSWLQPISGRLAAEGSRMEREEFRAFASDLIRQRLAGELKDELLYAEIQSELTPQEKAGLRQVLQNAQQEQIRRTGGSVTLAERQLQDANDQTIDSFIRDRERQILVAEKYRREIDDKVQVSQRDIRLFYERNSEQFNPPPVATIHRVRLSARNTDAIAEVQRRIAAGEPFPEIALIEDNTMSEPFTEREIDGPISEYEFYSVESLNEAAQQLAVGRTIGPIEHGSSVSWLHMSDLEDRSISLYDAQLIIENQLRAEQRRQLEQRYIFKLIRRAGLAEFDEIVANLTDISETWFYTNPEEQTDSTASAGS